VTVLTIFLLLMIFVLYSTCIVVPARTNCVKERLGKFAGVMAPGFHFLIPFIDRVAYRHEAREQIFDVPAQSCISRDNIQVEVDGLIYIKVLDPVKASYGIENYRIAAINLAQTTMRSEVGKLTLHESLSEREKLNHAVVTEIDKASAAWGVKVLRYEIMNINPSAQVIHTLEKQMEAERERRAEVTKATAEKEALINTSAGERQEAINISEGEKAKRINEAEGKAAQISLLADSTAYSIRRIAQAISQPGGDRAVKMRILEQYLDEFGKILDRSAVTVVPQGLANIKGFFEGLSAMTAGLNKTGKQ
jgi:regulator of protease activity HflC (stomatin/prohibitin superfamily)